MKDTHVAYLAVVSARAPVATPVFATAFAGRYWIVARRSTIKVAALRAHPHASLLTPAGDRWSMTSGTVQIIDMLRPPLSREVALDAALAPLASAAFALQNGRALATLWRARPGLLAEVATATKVLLVLHPTISAIIDTPRSRTNAVYTTRVGTYPVAVPARIDRTGKVKLSRSAARALEGNIDGESSVTTTSPDDHTEASGTVVRGHGQRTGMTIDFTPLKRTSWSGARVQT